jgi:hypothetical protein
VEPLPPLAGQRQLMIFGKRSVTYRVEYSTALGSNWVLRGVVPMTNLFRAVTVGNSPAPPVFYRARQ